MKKNYVLDTNVLIHDPNSIFKFEDNTVFIPHLVVEELDGLKTSKGDKGYNARESIRNLMSLENGNLMEGVKTKDGGIIKMFSTDWLELADLPTGWDKRKIDNLILLTVKAIEEDEEIENANKELNEELKQTILVTNDAAMFLKAQIMGIKVQEYRNDRITLETLYTGRTQRHFPDDIISDFSDNGYIKDFTKMYEKEDFFPNEYVNVKSWSGSSLLGKFVDKKIVKIDKDKKSKYIKPRNLGQKFLENALMTPYDKCPLCIVAGPAGTGKTLFGVACGLEQVMEDKLYTRMLLCRANITMDEDIGEASDKLKA